MDTEQPRHAIAIAAFAGGVLWALHATWAALRSGLPIPWSQRWLLVLNLVMGILAGVLTATFAGPSLITIAPAFLRDPWFFGFLLGAGTWELTLWAYDQRQALLKKWVGRFAKEEGQ